MGIIDNSFLLFNSFFQFQFILSQNVRMHLSFMDITSLEKFQIACNFLNQWVSKCGHQTRNISITLDRSSINSSGKDRILPRKSRKYEKPKVFSGLRKGREHSFLIYLVSSHVDSKLIIIFPSYICLKYSSVVNSIDRT